MATTSAGSITSFFAENGSIDGGITLRRSGRDPRRRELRLREHELLDVFHVGPEEVPGPPRRLVRLVAADVAAPHDPRADGGQLAGETGGLRVVEQDHVVASHEREELGRVAAEHRLVVPVLRLAEWAAVAGRPVQPVVEPLGDREEVGVAFDHDPAGVDADTPGVREQRLEQLGHATAGRGRVDVEHLPPVERSSSVVGEVLECREPAPAR